MIRMKAAEIAAIIDGTLVGEDIEITAPGSIH